MTAIAGIIDRNPQTNEAFVQAVEGYFDEQGDGPSQRVRVGDLDCHWRACRSAPVSRAESGATTAWVLGHVDATDIRRQSHAEYMAAHFQAKGPEGAACHGGLFMAIVHDGHEYYIFTDRLGLFPCYYAAPQGLLLLGSSSLVPVLHPAISRRLNRKGLIGHLLCMHEVLGETLWQGSRRLGVGEVLHFSDQGVEIVRQPSIPVSDICFDLPYEAQLDRLEGAMLEAFEPYKTEPVSLLFSGGVDSRLIAGYVDRLGVDVDAAYTLGIPNDSEFQCARRVCRRLGWPQRRIDVDLARFPRYAHRQIVGEQLANGLNNLTWWDIIECAENIKAPLLTGLLGDAVLGGSYFALGYDPTVQKFSFEKAFERMNVWALPRETICKLLPDSDTAGLITEIMEELRDRYESLPGYAFQRAWQFELMHHERFHIAGTLGRLANGVWPSAPFTHSAVLGVGGSIPACSLMGRRLQKDLLASRFRSLAQLPIDANAPYPRPLVPSLMYRIKDSVLAKTHLREWLAPKIESRYYYRVYDINNEGWRVLRDECRQAVSAVGDVIDVDCLREILPGSGTPIKTKDAIIDASGLKSLLGFVLWYRHYNGSAALT